MRVFATVLITLCLARGAMAADLKLVKSATADLNGDVDNDWYLVKTQSNLLGWANITSLSQNVEGMGGAG